MKLNKDKMDSPLSSTDINKYLSAYKAMGATHVDVATTIGHPNFQSYSKLWADAVHAKGMSVVFRCAHVKMEGLYGNAAAVGPARLAPQFWIDEAVNAIKLLGASLVAGDGWAIYPERTDGIFQDATSFLPMTGLPQAYADFFISLHNACKAVAPVGVQVGLSSNNASELLSGWMPAALGKYANVICIDYYVDGNPSVYDANVRAIAAKYGLPVFVEEGAPDRFNVPTRAQADAYYAVNKKLADEGILVGYGGWGGWPGNPESLINADFTLTDSGKSLQAWWAPITIPTPTPVPPPVVVPAPDPILADLQKRVTALENWKNKPL